MLNVGTDLAETVLELASKGFGRKVAQQFDSRETSYNYRLFGIGELYKVNSHLWDMVLWVLTADSESLALC